MSRMIGLSVINTCSPEQLSGMILCAFAFGSARDDPLRAYAIHRDLRPYAASKFEVTGEVLVLYLNDRMNVDVYYLGKAFWEDNSKG